MKKKKTLSKTLLSSILGVTLLVPSVITYATSPVEDKASKHNTRTQLNVSKIASFDTSLTDKDGGVAEIVKFNSDNKKFYLVNGKAQTIDIVNIDQMTRNTNQKFEKEKSIQIADAVNTDSFTYGDLTSIDINTKKKVIVAAVQHKNYQKAGKIVVMNYNGEVQQTFETGVQPDMVKISEDGRYILTADEGELRRGLENGVDPEGSVTIIDLKKGESRHLKFDDTGVIDDNVHIRNNGSKEDAVRDFEPEYIALSDDAKTAYVTLQENNAIATIDVKKGNILSVQSLGFKDHSKKGNELDAARDGESNMTNLPILGAYMPDSVAHTTINGESYLITANEGDATEWEEFENVTDFGKMKDEITLDHKRYKGTSKKKLQQLFDEMKGNPAYDKLEVLTDRGTDAIYTLGGRSFSIWKADTMELVYDSGSDFENITAKQFPAHFNASNDDIEMDKRSAKKGPEPEDVKIGQIGDKTYAFIGLERIGGVMAYDITNPKKSTFVNYTNTRDFSSQIAGDVSPEGLDFIPAHVSPTGLPLTLVGNEVSGTVSIHQMEKKTLKENTE
ncbi:choice-of-anchor I family protein [Bacillus sp. CGMCC 1.16541]|uniref:choice-of-anchor I family protein n=1 Tax=Bacillus sp. CGMCC 1.16541 TaxID=2185143 RepID=UPI000D726FC8|nr:choice-of-anchor I family protein [Bacillus sp. CGMCC 1.16541]